MQTTRHLLAITPVWMLYECVTQQWQANAADYRSLGRTDAVPLPPPLWDAIPELKPRGGLRTTIVKFKDDSRFPLFFGVVPPNFCVHPSLVI
jgi:hypothetical protein